MPAAPRIRTVRRDAYRNFLRKSKEFSDTAEHARLQGNHDACVSAAVHSAICAIDALTAFYLQVRHAGESHDVVLSLLSRVDLPKGDVERMSRHLSSLLGTKAIAEYEDRLTRAQEAEAMMKHLERLRSIVLGAIPE